MATYQTRTRKSGTRTTASYLAMSGASLIDLQRILGHKSATMTMRYAHLCDDHLADVHSRMATKFL